MTITATNKSEDMRVEDIEDTVVDTSGRYCRDNFVIGGETAQSNHAFQNPFVSVAQSDVSFYNEGIDMTVFSNTRRPQVGAASQQPAPENNNAKKPEAVAPQTETLPVKRGAVDVLRESSFTSNSASSGYYSDLASERNTPFRLSRASDVSERNQRAEKLVPQSQSQVSEEGQPDFSPFVTQTDRERISSRGRDMTVYMFVIGGKEESRAAQSLISSQPINLWKLQIF